MKYAVLFIALLASISSCRKQSNGFNDKINISAVERVPARELEFGCITDGVYPCHVAGLEYTTEVTGNIITISFTNIVCHPGSGAQQSQASCGMAISALSNGTYRFIINNGSKQSVGSITVTDDRYSFYFNTLNDITFTWYELLKIPANTMWGSFTYSDPGQSAIADTIYDSLRYFGAQPFTGPGGNYGYFQLGIGNTVSGLAPSRYNTTYNNIRNTICSYGTNKDKIHAFMYRFANRHAGRSYTFSYEYRTSDGDFFIFPPLTGTALY